MKGSGLLEKGSIYCVGVVVVRRNKAGGVQYLNCQNVWARGVSVVGHGSNNNNNNIYLKSNIQCT